MSTAPFFITDTSPIFSYSPCSNCAAPSRWQSAYSPGDNGYDVTFHQTNHTDSSVSFNITAAGLEVRSAGVCDAEWSINGSTYAGVCAGGLSDLPRGIHQVALRPAQNVTSFQFYGVAGKVELPDSGRYTNVTVDDTSLTFLLSPSDWTTISSKGIAQSASNSSLISEFAGNLNGFYNSSLSATTNSGAMVNITFQGSGIYVYGMSGPDGGSAQVWVDGDLSATLNLTNPWKAYSSLLFMGSGYNASEEHELSIVNMQAGKQLVIDYALLTTESPATTNKTHLILLIATISGVSALLLILGVATYLYCLRRRKNTSRRRAQYPFATGMANTSFSPSKSSSIDTWRKKNGPPSTPLSSTSGSGSGSYTGSSPRVEYRQPNVTPSHYTSPPEYPDYIPYRGPIEPRPEEVVEDEPPAIAGGNNYARGWLQAQASATVTSPTPTYSTGIGSERSGLGRVAHSIPRKPPPVRTRDRDSREGYDDIALDSYYPSANTGDDLLSPTTPSSLGLSGVTTTARRMTARMSTARLWPGRAGLTVPDSTAPSRMGTDRSVVPSFTTAGFLATSPSQFRIPSSSSTLHPSPIASSPPSTTRLTLRRGVSIKSVKTMRSFLSGLIWNPSTPLPVPLQDARPDSGIFPYQQHHEAPGRVATRPLVLEGRGKKGQDDTSPNLFIELNPNSPMSFGGGSRPGSEATWGLSAVQSRFM